MFFVKVWEVHFVDRNGLQLNSCLDEDFPCFYIVLEKVNYHMYFNYSTQNTFGLVDFMAYQQL